MPINFSELETVLSELNELTGKPTLTKPEERRYNFLLAAASAVKSGVSLTEIMREKHREIARAKGLPVPDFSKPAAPPPLEKRHEEARVWSHFVITGKPPADVVERRDTGVGNGLPEWSSGNTGYFVPRAWWDRVTAMMRWMDPLVDENVCTVINTTHGRPMQLPFYDDTAQYASVIGENSNQSANESDLTNPSEIDVSAYSYRTQPFRASLESFQDLEDTTTLIDLFAKFTAARIGRGAGRDLTVGNGVGKTLGLIPSLTVAGNCSAGTAVGSSEVTGGSQSGANSLGVTDVNVLFFSVDAAYRNSPKAAWLMADGTRQYLSQLLNKQGAPVFGDLAKDRSMLLGKPVYTSPSMASIGSAAIPIVFGDLSYWVTRHATGGDRVQLLRETYSDKGQVGLRSYSRYDGCLLYSASVSGTPPIKYLINHS